MEKIKEIIALIENSIKIDANNSIKSGNIIKDGFDKDVDDYRHIISNSQEWLAGYQAKLIKETGIQKLKIKFTNIMGYFIEIPLNGKNDIIESFIHKQTLVSSARYITEELKKFEAKVLEGENFLATREYELFDKIREEIIGNFNNIKKVSSKIGKIDMLSSLSKTAYNNNYTKPKITKNSDTFSIKSGRHPIIETIEKDFISNDLSLDKKEYIHIITGPNMGGKSTYLRQNALIILMSHIGSFIPAREAEIPLTDKLFSRVGASDNLFLGQSTFMVEMQEVANIINNSTKNSFIIIDEVGRGTSTYDGMSIAWSILKYIHNQIKSRTLFATHYHELVDESKTLKGVSNYSVAVGENDEGIVFLRKVIKGGIKKSYGLEVAKLAGLNQIVIEEAKSMLKKLEITNGNKQISLGDFNLEPQVKIVEKDSKVDNLIKNIDINSLTPIEALNIINDLKSNVIR